MISDWYPAHYILVGFEPIKVDDPIEWANWFAYADRTVAKTVLSNGDYVCTSFIGIDMQYGTGPPIVFETMVFPECEISWRYATWDQAVTGHHAAVLEMELWGCG